MRPWHISIDNQLYFLTTHCILGSTPFKDPNACKALIEVIRTKQRDFDFGLYAYVIMPDHYHLLLQLPENRDLSNIMNHLNGAGARKVNLSLSAPLDHIWQGGFHDVMIRSSREFAAKVNYIHQNPVTAGLVDNPDDYPYSSARFYVKTFGDCLLDPTLDEIGLTVLMDQIRTVLT